jgi:hypothetical protein
MIFFVLAFPTHMALAEDLRAALSLEQQQGTNESVDRAMKWLSSQQNADGSFSDSEGPAERATGYVVLAYLSRGHQPGQGPYGRQLSRAIDWLLSIQRADGSFCTRSPEDLPLKYTQPLDALALSEAYGSAAGTQSERIGNAIELALANSRRMQQAKKLFPSYHGGWNYGGTIDKNYSHLSNMQATSWELVFMRSAHNAGFTVPQQWVDDALGFIVRCYKSGPSIESDRRLPVRPEQGVFRWWPQPNPGEPIWANFGTTASGMLPLQLHGRRDDPMIRKAVSWLVEHPVPQQGTMPDFYYSCYMTTQAMSQVGGQQWKTFFPKLVRVLSSHQDADGRFRLDSTLPWENYARLGGSVFYTSTAVLCLTLPDQLLPIHQR